MSTTAKFIVVMILILTVTTIFVAPAVDLDPTALRAIKVASMLFAALVLAGCAIAIFLRVSFECIGMMVDIDGVRQSAANIVDLTCARLC